MSFYNNKYTKWLVGALVLMNMVLLFAFFTNRPHNSHDHRGGDSNSGERMQKFLEKKLNLSDVQKVKFKELGKAHFEKRKELYISIRTHKKDLIDLISNENPDTTKANIIADQIGELEAIKEKLLINHYLELQAECSPEQREKLEHVFKRRTKFRKGKKGKRDGKKKDAE